jgi:DNA-binding CsgD family transcriptional regulator
MVVSTRGDHTSAAAIGDELLQLGAAVSDPALLLAGDLVTGVTALYRGELESAVDHLESSLSRAQEFDDEALLALLPTHPGGISFQLAIAWFLRGDQGRSDAAAAGGETALRRQSDSISVAGMSLQDLWWRVCVSKTSGLADDARATAARCEQWGLVELAALARFWGAWAEQQEAGGDHTTHMTDELAALDRTGFRIWRTQMLALLATAHDQTGGRPEVALALVDEGLAEAARNGERYWEPELLRHRGELLADEGPARRHEAVSSLVAAIELARSQGSVTFRRRAETALVSVESAPGGDEASRMTTPLSLRELELLGLVGRGLSDKEIALELTISLATVHSHLDRIRDKTGRRRRPELIRLADQLGATNALFKRGSTTERASPPSY